MITPLIRTFAFTALLGSACAAEYRHDSDWLKLPASVPQLGDLHGDVAVSSAGEVYISRKDAAAGILVFAPDGQYLRAVTNAPNDFHGFVIRKDREGEFIYGPRLEEQSIVKLTLDGKMVLEIPAAAIPDRFKEVRPVETPKSGSAAVAGTGGQGQAFIRLTGMDVAPNGDLYVTDGYASSYVHRFDRHGKYLSSFGGKLPPYGFKTLHKIAIDTRFAPPRIIACDR